MSRQARRRRETTRVTVPTASDGGAVWLAAAALALLTILTFAQVRQFEFVNYDDFEYVVDNPYVAGGLTADNVAWAGAPLPGDRRTADVDAVPLASRVANAPVSYCAYLVKTVWPRGLIPFYPLRTNISVVVAIACVALLLGLTAAAVIAARRAPFVLVGWLWYVGTLLPVIGLVQVGGHAMADRFTYLPLTGIFIIVSWGVPAVLERRGVPGRVLTAAAASTVVVLAVPARAQSLHWRHGVELWEHTVRVDPDNARAYGNLGGALAARNRHEDAIRAYEEALRLQPAAPQTQHNLGYSLKAIGRRDEAIAHYSEAVRLQPDYTKARMQLANLLAERGSTDEAIAEYREAIRWAPNEPLAYVNLGVTLADSGRFAEGAAQMREAIRLDPRNARWRYFAGLMLIKAGRTSEAADLLREALTIDPNHAQAREALAQISR